MITFYALGNEYKMPSLVTEITISQYLRLSETQDISEQISILSGLPNNIELDINSMYQIQLTCEYFTTGIQLPETDLKALELQEQQFAAVYFSQQALATLPKHDALIFMLCYLYSGEDWKNNNRPRLHENHFDECSNLPAWQYLPLMSNYVEQLTKIQDLWNKQLKSSYTDDEIRAKVKDLESLGIFGTLMGLAQKNFDTYDNLFSRKWSEILLLLILNKKENEYQRRYQKIITTKK